jgi:hypothetical protein
VAAVFKIPPHKLKKNYGTSGKVAGSSLNNMNFFNLPNPASRVMALGSTQQTLTEMSTRNLSGGKGWAARMTDNLTAVCEPIV